MAKNGLPVIVLLLLAAAAGCGVRYDDAVVLAGQGRLLAAAQKYTAFAQAKPKDPDAPKALLAAADIYSQKLGLCAQSKPLLESLARNYPAFKMPEDVFRRIFVWEHNSEVDIPRQSEAISFSLQSSEYVAIIVVRMDHLPERSFLGDHSPISLNHLVPCSLFPIPCFIDPASSPQTPGRPPAER